MRVLIVDDDEQLRRAIRINLDARGHAVTEATDGEGAVVHAAADAVDLVILDLGLPGLSGTPLVRRLRSVTSAPILVLSGRTDSADKVDALDAGANDYVTKPFSINELMARTRALTRAPAAAPHTVVHLTGIDVDLTRHEIVRTADSTVVHLTPTEWELLAYLLRNPDRLVRKRELLTAVWGEKYTREDAYLRLFISQLRKKVEIRPDRPRHLITEPNLGYRYAP